MESQIILLVLLFWLLGRAAEIVVKALARISLRLHLSHFVIGFFILGMATTLPEFLVGIQAAINNIPTLSLGHLVGGSVVLLSLVVGLNAVINKDIKVFSSVNKSELTIINILILLPFLLAMDGQLTSYEGLVLMGSFCVYLFYRLNQKSVVSTSHINDDPMARNSFGPVKIKKSLALLVAGLILLATFSRFIVQTAGEIVNALGWSPLIFGLLVLSVGTNLPELAVTFRSRSNFRKPFAFGNILGSATANCLVAGMVAFLRPIEVLHPEQLWISGSFLLITLFFFDWFAISGKTLTRREGWGLIAIYVAFVVTTGYMVS